MRFTVLDTGIGVNADDARRIFDAFTQAEEGNTRRFSGTGLGLAVCRQLAQAMGGDVSFAPRAGGGSEFAVLLPLQLRSYGPEDAEDKVHAEDAAAAARLTAASGLAGAGVSACAPPQRSYLGRVLLAEDNLVNQEVISTMLETFGLEVVCAANGQEALAIALAGGFRLVFMDCQMPVMDGYEATTRIRAQSCMDERLRPLPIIALTASAYAEDRTRAQQAGMDDFVAKPVGLDDLALVLAAWLEAAPGNSADLITNARDAQQRKHMAR